MWRCLDCKNLRHSPFKYYGGATGFDPETLDCLKGHFYITHPSINDLRAANTKGDHCNDFDRGEPREDE